MSADSAVAGLAYTLEQFMKIVLTQMVVELRCHDFICKTWKETSN